MKRYFYALVVAVFATMSLAVTGCSKDDDGDTGGSVVGTWKVETMKASDDYWQYDYYDFKEDGTYKHAMVIRFMGKTDVEVDSSTWSKAGNQITIDGDTGTIKTLNSSTMVVSLGVFEITYKRCSADEMQKYL